MAIEVTPEAASPIHRIEEADDDAAMDFLFDALEAGAAAEELVESVVLLVICIKNRWGKDSTYFKLLLSLMML